MQFRTNKITGFFFYRIAAYFFLANTTTAIIDMIVLPLAVEGVYEGLPAPGWNCYEITRATYWPTFIHQSLALIILSYTQSSYDSFVVGLMLEVTMHIEILKHRIKAIPRAPKESQYDEIISCIIHQNKIYK